MSVTPGVIDAEMIRLFTEGACYVFASTLAASTGWPCKQACVIFTEDGEELQVHSFNRSPEGYCYDIRGRHTEAEMAAYIATYIRPGEAYTLVIRDLVPLTVPYMQEHLGKLYNTALTVQAQIILE